MMNAKIHTLLTSLVLISATTSALAYADTSTRAFKKADATMMDAMEAPAYTGDADRDFVTHMIPHHQGAVAMAEVELKYGKDPAIRQLAAGIIKAQKEEIALMNQWLLAHGSK